MPPRRKSAGRTKQPTRARKSRRAAPVRQPGARVVPASSGLAPGMHAINTYLAVANVTATMEFLEHALGFSRGVVLPDADGRLRYAEMRHGDSIVMLIRKGDEATATGGAAGLYTYVADVDRALAKARNAGAGVSDAEDRPWGDRVSVVTDPDGYRWVLATFKKLAPLTAPKG
jgi:uncharacterized glyoxalase superfamily protein PhnB